jgi:spore maturation protein SpmA
VIAILVGATKTMLSGNYDVINSMAQSVFVSAKWAIEIAIGLIGTLTLWLGLFAIAQASGVVTVLSKLTMPVLSRLLPDVPKGHPAFGSTSMNLAMSMLGIDNGALPAGLKAMRELESLNQTPGIATKAQQVFLVYMTASVTLLPLSIISYRMQAGAADPADVLLPLVITGYSGLLVGMIYITAALKIPILNRQSALWLLGLAAVLGILAYFAGQLPPNALNTQAVFVGNLAILAAITWFVLAGFRKGVPLFETFVRGASEGFTLAVELMPYLVAMLFAIGLLKSSGALTSLQSALLVLCQAIGADPIWAQALPHGLMKLLSGGAARSLMLDSFATNGVDSLTGHLSSLVQGAFDTTFYVLAACAAAAKLTNLGHAVVGALVANISSLCMALVCTRLFF